MKHPLKKTLFGKKKQTVFTKTQPHVQKYPTPYLNKIFCDLLSLPACASLSNRAPKCAKLCCLVKRRRAGSTWFRVLPCAPNQIRCSLGIQPAHHPCSSIIPRFSIPYGHRKNGSFHYEVAMFRILSTRIKANVLLYFSFVVVTPRVENSCSIGFYNNGWVFHLYLALQTMK